MAGDDSWTALLAGDADHYGRYLVAPIPSRFIGGRVDWVVLDVRSIDEDGIPATIVRATSRAAVLELLADALNSRWAVLDALLSRASELESVARMVREAAMRGEESEAARLLASDFQTSLERLTSLREEAAKSLK